MAGHLFRALPWLAAIAVIIRAVFRAGVAIGFARAIADAEIRTARCAQALTEITEEY